MMEIIFPGGLKVDARYKGHIIKTDQDKEFGGDGSAPEPFDLFFVSIGTCVGINVLRFCQERKIPTGDLRMTLSLEKNESSKRIDKVNIHIHMPPETPDKYKTVVARVADACSVKKHIMNPPGFEVVVG